MENEVAQTEVLQNALTANQSTLGMVDPNWVENEKARQAKYDAQAAKEKEDGYRDMALTAALRADPTNSDPDALVAKAGIFLLFLKGE